MGIRIDEGVLITGVYGAGKSTVAAEISYLLEQRRQPYALLDLDFLGWGVNSFDGSSTRNPFMLRNLAAVVSNYREGGISVFVLAYFVSSPDELRGTGTLAGCRCGSFACRCRCPISNSACRPP
jgi:adenylylsulfate kinase-like enzyme